MRDILDKAIIPLVALQTAINTYIWIIEENYKKRHAYLYTLLLLISFFILLREVKNVK
ncbi:MAG: hypothetical protein RMJ67_01225 [Elusimicrobiota bacterium]|nr:hypothetical protein [Endomicrobiia bacterium]MDW8165125.1 hypothetical protein [Elusimicrobiota bacterium]